MNTKEFLFTRAAWMRSVLVTGVDALRGVSRTNAAGIVCDERIALGAPWLILTAVGMLGVAGALRHFEGLASAIIPEETKSTAAAPHAPNASSGFDPLQSEIEVVVEINDKAVDTEEALGDANEDQPSAKSEGKIGEKAGKKPRKAAVGIASKKATTVSGKKKQFGGPSQDSSFPIVVGLLERATDLASYSTASVDNLIAVAERQARLDGTPGMDASLQLAASEAQQLETDRERARALSKVTKAQARLGEVDEAKRTSRMIDDVQFRDAALIAVSQVEAGDANFAGAKRTAMGIAQPARKADALAAIAKSQARRWDPLGARSTAYQIPDGTARSVALQGIAMVQASQADLEGARLTVRSIPDPSIKETAQVNLVMRSLSLGDVCCAQFIAGAISTKEQRDRAFEAIARHRAKTGDLLGASQLVSRIGDKVGKSRALAEIALENAKAADFHSAKNAAARIPVSEVGERTLAGIAKVQAMTESDARGARFTAGMIKDADVEAAAMRDIAGALARKGEISHAMMTAKRIPVLEYRSSAFLEIGKQHLRKGEALIGQQMLDNAREAAFCIDQPATQSKQLCTIALEEARSGDFRDAVFTAHNIGQPAVRDSALAKIAVELATGGEVDGAWNTVESIESETTQHDTRLAVAATIGAKAPVENAPLIVRHFATPDEKIRFILSVADRQR